MKYSKYQMEIFTYILKEKGSLSIRAVAGSGKTTTLVTSAKLLADDKNLCFLAFNKAIADELRKRLPEKVNVKTFNAVGHAALMRSGRKFNENKLRKIMDEFRDSLPFSLRKFSSDIFRLVGLAKSEGLVPKMKDLDAKNKGLIPDTDDSWVSLVHRYGLDVCGEDPETITAVCRFARKVLVENLKRDTEFDFADQIYLPFVFALPLSKYDVLFVDEAQDVSQIQHYFIDNMMKAGGRLIACGDPDQAIYGFRGADATSMQRLVERYACKELPLSISYRCPKSVVREARRFVPQIEARDDADEGVVHSYEGTYPELLKDKDMVLSRYNAGLITVALSLLERHMEFTYQGEDLSKEIIKMIELSRAKDLESLRERVEAHMKEASDAIEESYDPSRLARFIDACMICLAFIRVKHPRTIDQLVHEVEDFFKTTKKNKGGVLLSTIHRAKGLEADRVFLMEVVDQNKREIKQEWLQRQENNLTYVAVTRAKKELHIILPPEEKEKPKVKSGFFRKNK